MDSPTVSTTARSRAVVEKWTRAFDRVLVLAGGSVGVVVALVIGTVLLTSVTLRYVSGSSLGFATELPSYLFPWLVCGGIVAAAGAGGHLAVDFFVLRLPAAIRRYVVSAMWVLVALVLANTVFAALRIVDAFTGQSTAILGWPAVGSYLAFPLTLIVLAVHSSGRAVAAFVDADVAQASPAGEGNLEEVAR